MNEIPQIKEGFVIVHKSYGYYYGGAYGFSRKLENVRIFNSQLEAYQKLDDLQIHFETKLVVKPIIICVD